MITPAELAQLRANVERGIRWLDEHEPTTRDRVDWPNLDICSNCIFKQLYGGFSAGLEYWEMSLIHAKMLGFDGYGLKGEDYPPLTAIWRELGPRREVAG